jgi:protease-4
MFKLLNCLLVLLLISLPGFAQGIEDFALKRGIGVRAAGMGSAFTAVADDASAVFYNPAGLAVPGFCYTSGDIDTNETQIDGNFELAKLGYIGYGAWSMRNAVSDEAKVSVLGFGNRQGWLSWGTSWKGAKWKINDVSGDGGSADIGFLVRVTPNLKVGLLVQDVLSTKNYFAPATGRLGLSFSPLGGRLLLAADLEVGDVAQSGTHIGVETNVLRGLAVRGGFDRGSPTAGLSLDLAVFSFDYAALFSDSQRTVQRFEIGIKILPEKERPFSIIKPKEYALIDVSGDIKGGRTEYSLLGGTKPGLDSILSQIRRASKDSSIDGIMLKIGGFGGGLGGMAIVQEIRSELIRARKKGKKIVAYIEGSALGDEYYLASVADKIVAPPGAAIGGFGKSLQIYKIKGLFKKIGIEREVFTQGKYKGALDPFTSKLTGEQEEMVQGLVADLYRQMLTDIAADRHLSLEKIKGMGDGLIYTARVAKEMGLVDEIGYYKDSKKVAAKVSGEENAEEAHIIEPRLVEPQEAFLTRMFGVAVIEIDGEIVSGAGGENVVFGGRFVGSETITDYIRKASDDIFVKAIILRINSPGGSAIASGEIYKALKYAKEKNKIVIASIGSVGASGGYYIASAADRIVADRASITGSIGVIGYFTVISDLLKKLDVEAEVVKEGKHADMFSGLRNLSTEEAQSVECLQKESYDEFVQAVAQGRHLSVAEVEKLAQGKIYTGAQALDVKLVDKVGGFSDAVDYAIDQAEIAGEPRLLFYHQPSPFFNFGEGMVEVLGLKSLKLFNLFQGAANNLLLRSDQEKYN